MLYNPLPLLPFSFFLPLVDLVNCIEMYDNVIKFCELDLVEMKDKVIYDRPNNIV